jgi:hypothetical protein
VRGAPIVFGLLRFIALSLRLRSGELVPVARLRWLRAPCVEALGLRRLRNPEFITYTVRDVHVACASLICSFPTAYWIQLHTESETRDRHTAERG